MYNRQQLRWSLGSVHLGRLMLAFAIYRECSRCGSLFGDVVTNSSNIDINLKQALLQIAEKEFFPLFFGRIQTAF